ncbi:hypothetical protein D3C77_555020 [compost metagenome]
MFTQHMGGLLNCLHMRNIGAAHSDNLQSAVLLHYLLQSIEALQLTRRKVTADNDTDLPRSACRFNNKPA